MTMFPLLDVETLQTTSSATDKLYRDVQWDVETNRPVWRGGNPVWVTGAAAIQSWIARTLLTHRRSKDLFSASYGCDLMTLAGRAYSDDIRQSEAVRLVRECLCINPYITDVQQIVIDFSGSQMSLSCKVETIYGEVTVDGIG